MCEELLKQHNWESGVIAFDWADRVKDQYNETTYSVFYDWLKKYVRGWGDCDDFWVRRASAVVLMPAILHNDYEGICPYQISDALLFDRHDLVQKGYGFMSKINIYRNIIEGFQRLRSAVCKSLSLK